MKKDIDFEQLKHEYASGKPVPDICSQFGISKQTLFNRLRSEHCGLHRIKIHDDCDCPLFSRDYYNIIQCENVGEWEQLSLSFRDKDAKNAYKKKFCNCRNYENCQVYRTMLSFLE